MAGELGVAMIRVGGGVCKRLDAGSAPVLRYRRRPAGRPAPSPGEAFFSMCEGAFFHVAKNGVFFHVHMEKNAHSHMEKNSHFHIAA